MKSIRWFVSLALALALTALAVARPDDPQVEGAKSALAQVLLAEGSTEQRVQHVDALAALDTDAAARGLVEALERLAARTAQLEVEAERTRTDYVPYRGYSFKDPKAWSIKERLQKQMEREDKILRSDAGVALGFTAAISRSKDAGALAVYQKATNCVLPHARRVVFAGLIRNAQMPPGDLAKKAMQDVDPTARLAALEAIAERKDPSLVEIAIKGLAEKGWPHRQAAARALGAQGDIRAVAPLVAAMQTEDGRLVEDYADALTKITGEALGAYPDAWKSWFEDHKAELAAKGVKPVAPKGAKADPREPVNYYGVQTRSRRIMFLIDVSGSMNEPIGAEPAKGPVTGGKADDEDPIEGLKVDVAKKMLKRAIRGLDEDAWFNVIVFNHAPRPFMEGMVQATQDNKNQAYLMINDLKASGSTYTYGALKLAFSMAGMGVTDKFYDPAIDTVFLLSDGAPTDNDLETPKDMDPKILLDSVREWNTLKKLKVHTIAIDPRIKPGGFIKFMKQLAHENGGTYSGVGAK